MCDCGCRRLSELAVEVRAEDADLIAEQKGYDPSSVCVNECFFSVFRNLEDCINVTILRHMTVSTKKTLMSSSLHSLYAIAHLNIRCLCAPKHVTLSLPLLTGLSTLHCAVMYVSTV